MNKTEERVEAVVEALRGGPLRGDSFMQIWSKEQQKEALGDQMKMCACGSRSGCPNLFKCKRKEWRVEP